MVDHLIQCQFRRGIVPKTNLGQGITNKTNVDAVLFALPCGWKVVSSETCDGNVLCAQRVDALNCGFRWSLGKI